MAERLMSDTEIRRRKKAQGHISQATGGLGLAALGGTMLATKKGGKFTAKAFNVVNKPVPKAFTRKKMKATTAPILATAAGIGGAGSFNFAAYTNAESRKKKAAVVKNLDTPYFGEEGFAKSFNASVSRFDAEKSRQKRADRYPVAAGLVSGVAAGGAALKALEAGGHQAKATKLPKNTPIPMYTKKTHKLHQARQGRAAMKSMKSSGKLLALSGTALAAEEVLRYRAKSDSWKPHSVSKNFGAYGGPYD